MFFVGIDPGFTGAIACIDDKLNVHVVVDMPVLTINKKTEYDRGRLILILKDMFDNYMPDSIILEKVGSMPGQGISSTCRFCHGAGLLEGILLTLFEDTYELVIPRKWQAGVGILPKSGKEASLCLARRLFPLADLKFKKHHGRADALLMALYALGEIMKLKPRGT